MNIKHLFLLLLLVVGFAACSSKEDENGELESGEVTLSLKLKPQGGYATKADEIRAWVSESNIKSFVILIFRSDRTAPDILSGTNTDSEATISLPAGINLDVYAFANLSDATAASVRGVTSKEQLAGLTEQLAVQATDQLTMASTEGTTLTGLSSTNNQVTVSLTRLVSRIQISSIKTKFLIANDYTVKINGLKLGNIKQSSKLYTNSATEVDGKGEGEVVMTNEVNTPLSNTLPFEFIAKNFPEDRTGQNTIPYSYVFENTNAEAPTQLLLNASLFDAEGKEISRRDFKVTINSAGAQNHTYIKRNYIYDLGLTFNDTSFDMAALVVKVTIVPWGKVHQSSEVD